MARLTDRPDMTLDVYRGRKTTMQQNQLVSGRPTPRRPVFVLIACWCVKMAQPTLSTNSLYLFKYGRKV